MIGGNMEAGISQLTIGVLLVGDRIPRAHGEDLATAGPHDGRSIPRSPHVHSFFGRELEAAST